MCQPRSETGVSIVPTQGEQPTSNARVGGPVCFPRLEIAAPVLRRFPEGNAQRVGPSGWPLYLGNRRRGYSGSTGSKGSSTEVGGGSTMRDHLRVSNCRNPQAIADLQVSPLSGGNDSLCRHSQFGGGDRQFSLVANAYFGPATAFQCNAKAFAGCKRTVRIQTVYVRRRTFRLRSGGQRNGDLLS